MQYSNKSWGIKRTHPNCILYVLWRCREYSRRCRNTKAWNVVSFFTEILKFTQKNSHLTSFLLIFRFNLSRISDHSLDSVFEIVLTIEYCFGNISFLWCWIRNFCRPRQTIICVDAQSKEPNKILSFLFTASFRVF